MRAFLLGLVIFTTLPLRAANSQACLANVEASVRQDLRRAKIVAASGGALLMATIARSIYKGEHLAVRKYFESDIPPGDLNYWSIGGTVLTGLIWSTANGLRQDARFTPLLAKAIVEARAGGVGSNLLLLTEIYNAAIYNGRAPEGGPQPGRHTGTLLTSARARQNWQRVRPEEMQVALLKLDLDDRLCGRGGKLISLYWWVRSTVWALPVVAMNDERNPSPR